MHAIPPGATTLRRHFPQKTKDVPNLHILAELVRNDLKCDINT